MPERYSPPKARVSQLSGVLNILGWQAGICQSSFAVVGCLAPEKRGSPSAEKSSDCEIANALIQMIMSKKINL